MALREPPSRREHVIAFTMKTKNLDRKAALRLLNTMPAEERKVLEEDAEYARIQERREREGFPVYRPREDFVRGA